MCSLIATAVPTALNGAEKPSNPSTLQIILENLLDSQHENLKVHQFRNIGQNIGMFRDTRPKPLNSAGLPAVTTR